MRTTKELLVIMLENINDKFQTGLCGLVDTLYKMSIISGEEHNPLMNCIRENRPEHTYDREWYWKPGIKKPRVKWLKEQIEKL